jgi:flagellar hook-associated protein 3 FlgL
MRVTFAASQRAASEGIARAAERMAHYQRQVSTGLRVEKPSDDPSAAASAIVERGAIAAIDQFSLTSDAADSRLRIVDSVLSDLINKLTSAQTTIMSVRGSTAPDSQRNAAAQELLSLREAVLENLNTSFRGTYVFAGAAGTTRPFAKNVAGTVDPYAGSTREVDVDIDRGRAVTVAFDGSVLSQGTDATDVFAAFDSAAAAAVAGDDVALGAALDAITRAFDRATQVQSRVGASLRGVADQQLKLDEVARASQARVSTLEEASLVEAISGMQQAETTYTAALGAAARIGQTSLFDFLR